MKEFESHLKHHLPGMILRPGRAAKKAGQGGVNVSKRGASVFIAFTLLFVELIDQIFIDKPYLFPF